MRSGLYKALILATGYALVLSGCSDEGSPVGSKCEATAECADNLQCIIGVCNDRCGNDVECGEGFICGNDGICEVAMGALGDFCTRERDCGPGLACPLEADYNNDGFLEGSCVEENSGGTMGNACKGGNECRNGICADGVCTQLCLENNDCPDPFECAIFVIETDETMRFRGCYSYEPP